MKNLGLLLFIFIFQAESNCQTLAERKVYTAAYNLNVIDLLKKDLISQSQKNVLNIAKYNFPKSFIDFKDRYNELQGVTDDGVPLYFQTDNNGSGVTIKASRLYLGGGLGLNVQGQNMIAGVWDGGATRLNHDHFQNRVVQRDLSTMALSAHATHVVGTICQNKVLAPIARGMAFESQVWANDWTNDSTEVIEAATDGLLVSNHSYGFSALTPQNTLALPLYYFGAYLSNSRNWDLVMNQLPNYLMVTSAGNDRDSQTLLSNKGGYDLLSGLKVCKNNIVVGAINNIPTYINASTPVMSAFSNWGPCDDGRIKPDIVAKGVSVVSTTSVGATSAVATLSGTSMAAPSVTGGLLLLQQHYKNINNTFMFASTLKGLALHTASEAGLDDGPDYSFGWGVLNCEAAANLISTATTTSRIQELMLEPGQTITLNVMALGSTSNPLAVSISWTDPAGVISTGVVDATTPILVNDLDLNISKGNINFLPWKLSVEDPTAPATTGINSVDPFEKVVVNNATGAYTITISHKGTMAASQRVSLIISGISQVLSSDSQDKESSFIVYPNPATDRLNFMNFSNLDFDSLSIVDIAGKEIKVNSVNNQIDISALQNGIYLLKFTSNGKPIIKKFIKQ